MSPHRWPALIAVLALLAPSASAVAKPRGCFTKAEQQAEEIVRYGLKLREGGRGCDGQPWYRYTLPAWEAVDKLYGPQFRQQTDIRTKAFQREFANDAEHRLSLWNARIVFYYRHYPLSGAYCDDVKKMLANAQKDGWVKLTKQAHLSRDEVRMTYEPCDK
jgi:hypothetical protein